jgi:hypothetical protein
MYCECNVQASPSNQYMCFLNFMFSKILHFYFSTGGNYSVKGSEDGKNRKGNGKLILIKSRELCLLIGIQNLCHLL